MEPNSDCLWHNPVCSRSWHSNTLILVLDDFELDIKICASLPQKLLYIVLHW